MVAGNVLQGVSDALNQIILFDYSSHDGFPMMMGLIYCEGRKSKSDNRRGAEDTRVKAEPPRRQERQGRQIKKQL
jgi:hypothetical protein